MPGTPDRRRIGRCRLGRREPASTPRRRHLLELGTAAVLIALAASWFVWPFPSAPSYTDISVAADTDAGDWYGSSVAIAGDLLAIGAFRDSETLERAGAVYVGERHGTSFRERAKLAAPEAAAGNQAGFSVALDGGWLAVGAVGGFGEEPPGHPEGLVDIYRHDGKDWHHHVTLVRADGLPNDRHGFSLALDGDMLAVGARGFQEEAGAVFIYRLDELSIAPTRLQAPTPVAGDRFGEAVALAGTTLVVGAPGRDLGASDSGAVFIFEARAGVWLANAAPLVPPTPQAQARFGVGVDISGDEVIVGASHWAPNGPGGSVWFASRREDGTWSEPVELAADEAPGDMIGFRVAIDGAHAVASAHLADVYGKDSGAVLLFSKTADGWTRHLRLVPPDGDRGDVYGISLALDDKMLVIGAEQADAAGSQSGGIYLLDLDALDLPAAEP